METAQFSASVGQAEFLNLFVAQLQYQDPLEPVGQQDFLAQLAQFSTVEGLENLNAKQASFNELFASTLQLQQLNGGADLLGKSVTWGTDGTSGIASEIQQSNGQVLVRVGEHLIPVADIQSVSLPPVAK